MPKRILQNIDLDPAAKAALDEMAIERGQSASDLARTAVMELLGPVTGADNAPPSVRPRRGHLREHKLALRLNEAEMRRVEEMASRVNLTRSAFVRRIVTGTTLPAPGNADAVIDLFSRRVIGWSLQSRQTTDVVLQALLMAVWRRKPKSKVLVHSDQGSQFTSMDWAAFLKHHNLEHSMSRRGNCHDNAVAESFFNLLKRERIRRRTYRTRQEARKDVFDYIEMFYNPKRKHVRNGMLSPVEFERQKET